MKAILKQLINEIQELKDAITVSILPWLDINETSSYVKLSVSTLRKMTSGGKIPFKRVGNGARSKLLFSKKQLDLWITTGKINGFTKRDKENLDTWI